MWLLIFAVLIFTQQPAQPPQGKGAAKSNSAQSASKPRDAQQQQTPAQTPAPTIQPTDAQVGTEHEPRAVADGDKTEQAASKADQENLSIQRKLVWFTGVLAVVGVLQVVVAFMQWLVYRRQAGIMAHQAGEMVRQRVKMGQQLEAMQGQLEQMKSSGEQTDKIIEQATKHATSAEGQLNLMRSSETHTETLAAQAVKQSDLTQRQLDLTNRPWICIDSVTAASDFTFKDSGEAVIFFAYQVRNVGHSVAQHLQPWFEPIITGIHDPAEVRGRISTQLKRPIDSALDHGKLIFPSQILVETYPVLIRKEVVENAIQNSPFKGADNKPMACFGFELFVCFDYQSTLDPSIHHQTQSMYAFSYADSQGRLMGAFYPTQRVYPVAKLALTYKGYGAYAD